MPLADKLAEHFESFPPGKLVDFDPLSDRVYPFDFTSNNPELTLEIISDTNRFTKYISNKLTAEKCRYGIGGYNENRTIYARSNHFNTAGESRSLHLGTDIWGEEGTIIFCPLDASVHSFRFNNAFGDYGATIILKHQIKDDVFYSLYGHLSLSSIKGIEPGQFIPQGTPFAKLGNAAENGNWPPHLHFQLIKDLEGMSGDYPGVCRFSEREKYLKNCPNPDLILFNTFK